MDVSVNVYKGLRGYWTRRSYHRLAGADSTDPSARTPDRPRGRRRSRLFRWRRVRVARRVKLIVRSPKRFLIWLRDAYVNMMMGLATSRVCSAGYGGYGCPVADAGMGNFGNVHLKEYDKRVIVEIYKTLAAAQGQLVPSQAGNVGSGAAIACRRR